MGSTLLAQALEDTGIAGRPREWLNSPDDTHILERAGASTAAGLRDHIHREGTTPNGILGGKYGMTRAHHDRLTALFTTIPGVAGPDPDGRHAWSAVFPACRHIFMTRRNKVRLAASWWRAIRTSEWHRPTRPTTAVGKVARAQPPADLAGEYNYDAIEHLFTGASLREADMQEQFTRWGIVPHTVVYEDFIAAYEPTVRDVLDFLDIPERRGITIPPPAFEPLADAVTEEWTRRFQHERQAKPGGA